MKINDSVDVLNKLFASRRWYRSMMCKWICWYKLNWICADKLFTRTRWNKKVRWLFCFIVNELERRRAHFREMTGRTSPFPADDLAPSGSSAEAPIYSCFPPAFPYSSSNFIRSFIFLVFLDYIFCCTREKRSSCRSINSYIF